ncbi:hypothetical protein BI344_04450 [Chromobacterium sphagni]|uniref:Uncharacterized protein n=1 Tax=Chromobacterium sphagni TaxID=1903179 RepID=A0ABX3CIA0_9NEIS|nr:hypothetical protein BI344_04450 [Chromobacterium sphagni]
MLAAAAILAGCAAPKVKISANAETAMAFTAKVGSKRPFYTNLHRDFGPLTLYWLQDNRGEKTPVVSSNANYAVGQCVTLWRSSQDSYPKISAANRDCSTLKQQPRSVDT